MSGEESGASEFFESVDRALIDSSYAYVRPAIDDFAHDFATRRVPGYDVDRRIGWLEYQLIRGVSKAGDFAALFELTLEKYQKARARMPASDWLDLFAHQALLSAYRFAGYRDLDLANHIHAAWDLLP